MSIIKEKWKQKFKKARQVTSRVPQFPLFFTSFLSEITTPLTFNPIWILTAQTEFTMRNYLATGKCKYCEARNEKAEAI